MEKIPGGNALLKPIELLKRVGISYKMTVGDFGCGGQGQFALQAATMVGEDGLVYGVDVLKSALTSLASMAKQRGTHNVKTVWSNLEIFGATKIAENSVDVGLIVNVLFQSSKRRDFLRETVRMVKPGGKILVVDWKTTSSPLGPPPKVRVDPKELLAAAKELGLKKIDEFEAGQFHWGLIFVK